MDFNSILQTMMSGGKNNPAFEQLMAVSAMLNKLPKDEQKRVITNFVNDLNDAVSKVEGK